jgi:hypothetical protein
MSATGHSCFLTLECSDAATLLRAWNGDRIGEAHGGLGAHSVVRRAESPRTAI